MAKNNILDKIKKNEEKGEINLLSKATLRKLINGKGVFSDYDTKVNAIKNTQKLLHDSLVEVRAKQKQELENQAIKSIIGLGGNSNKKEEILEQLAKLTPAQQEQIKNILALDDKQESSAISSEDTAE